jgi:hypothetical protein
MVDCELLHAEPAELVLAVYAFHLVTTFVLFDDDPASRALLVVGVVRVFLNLLEKIVVVLREVGIKK